MTKQRTKKEKVSQAEFGEEQHGNPYKSERIDMEDGRICIKYPIWITKDRLALLDKICITLEEPHRHYLAQALYEKIDSDLHTPEFLGKAFCDNLLEEWNVYQDEVNDYRIFQYSTKK